MMSMCAATLVVALRGTPLGLVDQHFWVRRDTRPQRRGALEAQESTLLVVLAPEPVLRGFDLSLAASWRRALRDHG